MWDKRQIRTEWAIVTGASGGVGRAFSVALADRGYPVLLVGRRREGLERVATEIRKLGGRAEPFAADLATNEGVESVLTVAQTLPEVGVLVNNAGVGAYGPFVEQPLDRELEQVSLNIGAVVALTRSLLPRMLLRRRGQIINVASVLSFMPTPYFAAYAATKAFVLHFTEALAHELRGSGVRVLATCPGPLNTEFARIAGAEAAHKRLPLVSPDEVVEASLRAAAAGRVVRTVGAAYRLLAFLVRITPRFLMRRIMGIVYAPASDRSTGESSSVGKKEDEHELSRSDGTGGLRPFGESAGRSRLH